MRERERETKTKNSLCIFYIFEAQFPKRGKKNFFEYRIAFHLKRREREGQRERERERDVNFNYGVKDD